MKVAEIISHSISFVFVVLLACSGKGGEVAEEPGHNPAGGGGGLRIDGTCTEETVGAPPETHPIDDIYQLREDAMSFCYAQVVEAEKGDGTYSITEDHCKYMPVDYCSPWFCSMQLALCVGQFMMMIADTLKNMELHVERYSGEYPYYYPYTYIFNDAEPTGETADYVIYPQSTKNKTLALREAMEAFRYAGLFGSKILSDEGADCLESMIYHDDYNSYNTYILNSQREWVFLKDLFSITFAETISAYEEATQRTMQNVVNVADSMMSEERNYSEAARLMWNGDPDNPYLGAENSRKAALLTLYGMLFLYEPSALADSEIDIPVDKESIKNAIKLLQSTRVVAVGGGTDGPGDRDVEDVVDDIRTILNEQYGTETDPIPYGDQPSDNDELLRMFGTSREDITIARKYLDQVVRTFKKTQVFEDPDGSGPSLIRQYGYMDAVKNNPAAYWKGEFLTHSYMLFDPAWDSEPSTPPGMGCNKNTSGMLFCNYSDKGASQSFDYFRWAAVKALDSDPPSIPEDYRKYFVHTAKIISGLVGDGRVVVSYWLNTSTGAVQEVTIDIYGVVVPEGETPWDPFFFYTGEEGYECVQYGSLDGYECHPEDYLIDAEEGEPSGLQEMNHLGPTVRFVITSGNLPGGRDQSNPPALNSDWPIFIYYKNPSGNMSLLFKVNLPDYNGYYPGYDSMAISTVSLMGLNGPGTALGAARDSDQRSTNDTDLDSATESASFRNYPPGATATGLTDCTGLPADFVPPLENEITSDSDPYENSWRHYLDLAKEAAAQADALGEELISAGLEMDMRAESAIEALEEICGDVGDLDIGIWGGGYDPDSPTSSDNLKNCVYNPANHIPYVALGNKPVCIYKDTKTGLICKCREGENCPECPWIPPKGGDCVWEGKPDHYEDPTKIDGDPPPPYGDTGLLEIFDAEGTKATANCDDLKYLREYFLRNYKDVGGNLQYPASCLNPICPPPGDPCPPGPTGDCNTFADASKKNRIVAHLDEAGLFDSDYLGNLLANLEIRHSFYGYYYAKIFGTPLFSMDILGFNADLCPVDNRTGDQINCSSYDARTDYGVQAISNAIMLSYFAASTPKIIEGKFIDNVMEGFATYHPDWFDENNFWDRDENSPDNWVKVIQSESLSSINYFCNDGITYTPSPYDRAACISTLNDFWKEGGIVTSNDVNNKISAAASSGDANANNYHPCGANISNDNWKTFQSDASASLLRLRDYLFNENDSSILTDNRIIDNEEDVKMLYKIYAESLLCMSDNDTYYYDGCVSLSTCSRHTEYDGVFWKWEGANKVLENIFNALLFACEVSKTANQGNITSATMPDIVTEADLIGASNYFRWLGDNVRRTAAKVVLQDLNVIAYDGVKAGGITYLYPGYRGRHLEEMNNLMVNLDDFRRSALALSDQMSMVATQIAMARSTIRILETQQQKAHLQNMKEILDRTQQIVVAALDIMSSVSLSAPWQAGAAAAKAAVIAIMQSLAIDIVNQVDDLEKRQMQMEIQSALIQCYQSLSSINTSIQEIVLDIFDSYYGTTNSMERIMALEFEAQQLAEKAGFRTDEGTQRVYHVNKVMRMRYNTLLTRYTNAFLRAKKLAMIARKAIEFRLGVNLMDMNDPMILVPPPSSWANKICTMTSIDYAKIRESNPDDIETGYADEYIGDYVQMLEDFVESYPMNFPFMEADDTAVISLKNDYYKEKIPCPSRPSTNLLLYSEDLGSSTQVINEETGEVLFIDGWQEDSSACAADEPCIEVWEDGSVACDSEPECNAIDIAFGDLKGRADHVLEPTVGDNKGFIYQVVRNLNEDWYILGWKHLFLSSSGSPVPYRINVKQVVGEVETTQLASFDLPTPIATDQWEDGFLAFNLDEYASVKIEFHPSASDDTGVFGDVWLWGFQLNRFDGYDHTFVPDHIDEVRPKTYERTSDERFITDYGCQDLDGRALRKKFTRVCAGGTECYYEATFAVNLKDIESGRYFTSGILAIDNYNYRHKDVALNFVGSNIKDCSVPGATSSCYENAFVPYTLIHSGRASIRNHEFQYVEFPMVTGKIEHGKGLAAEVVVTNPLTGSQPTLLGPYINAELRGRPIQGQYTLRIYDMPELAWENVEDIQLIWDYHYWTRFGD